MPGTSHSKATTIQGRKSRGSEGVKSRGRSSRSCGTQAGDPEVLIVKEKGVQVGTYPSFETMSTKAQKVERSGEIFPKTKDTSSMVYLFMRGKVEYVRRLKNAFVKEKRVVENYGGQYIGMSEEIKRYEGDLYHSLPSQCFIIIRFSNMNQAERWTQSSTIFKQKDFPSPADEVEIFAVPMKYIPQEDLTAFQLTEMYGLRVDPGSFQDNYIKHVSKLMDRKQIYHGVVATHQINRLRNCMIRPNTFILLHCADSEDKLKSFYDSPEYCCFKDYRHKSVAENDTCFFTIQSVTD